MDLDADVVVVGSGCTGGWVCKVLTEGGHRVLLIEAGRAVTVADYPSQWYDTGTRHAPPRTDRHAIQKNHPAFCESNQALWIDDVDNPYVTDLAQPFVWIRARLEGGRSNLWGGQCWRLTQQELAAPESDGIGERWPLDYRDLVPHYEEIEAFHEVTGRRDNDDRMPNQCVTGEVNLTDAESVFMDVFERAWNRRAIPARSAGTSQHRYADRGDWPRFSSLGSTLPAALATGNLRILNDAIAVRLDVDARGRQARSLRYIDAATSVEKHVTAKAFVLCASTIESTRILLNSTDPKHPYGLGNASGTLGRFLMDHIGTYAVGTVKSGAAQGTFFGGRHGLYIPRLPDTDAAARFHRSYGCWLSLGRPMGQGQNAIITAIGEMLPYADNRVTLDPTQVDRWGIPVPAIACTVRANENEMRRHQHRSVLELARLARMDVTVGPSDATLGAMVHEVGTARMGADPCTSFCNSVCQSWEVPNVFVPDGACWTTSAYQNPTLTMMALASRCGHFVHQQLARHS